MKKYEDFKHGDIIRVVSNERSCGLDEATFTALVVETKQFGLIAIPQDFQAHIYAQVRDGIGWETEIEWLLGRDVEIELLERVRY